MKKTWLTFLLISSVACGTALAATEIPKASEFLQKHNLDHDSTLELNELDKAANARFGAADTSPVSKLGLTRSDLAKIHLNAKGIVTREEYLKLIQNLFEASDKDHDGSLDVAELGNSAGRDLRRLLK